MTSSGVNIDCRYIRYIKHYQPVPLPRPRRKKILHDIDGGEIPIIHVTIGAFE